MINCILLTNKNDCPDFVPSMNLDLASAYQLALNRNLNLQVGRYTIAAAEIYSAFAFLGLAGWAFQKGLSISYGLIRDNGGYMRIKSLLNEYTAIIIDLPAAKNRRE